MKFSHSIIIAAIAADQSAAFQPAISRKALLQNLVKSSASAGVLLLPQIATAAEPKRKKQALRGGKNMSDKLHNGTDLNRGESSVASGLLDKMGLVDITPDKGANSRAPPAPKKS